MLPAETIILFMPAAILLALAPGPDNIFVLTQSAMNGRLAGVFVTLGLCTGLLFHTMAVSLGAAAILAGSGAAFTALKLFGAGYLLWLAFKAFRAGRADLAGAPPRASPTRLYLRGLVMNAANPKVALFFLAFLPQFADPARGALIMQLMMLGALMVVATILVFGSIALGGGVIGDWLRQRPGAQIWINRAAGVIFVGLALRLLTAQR